MHAPFRAAFFVCLIVLPVAAAEPPRKPEQPPATRTGKERLGGKDADEQRVDDCKVPPERRTRPRPAACPSGNGR
jgi:hypothetical protein